MLSFLFGRRSSSNQAVADALYGRIVAAARQPRFYSEWGVPDTPLGRFEMLSVHMVLFMHRTRQSSGVLKDVVQEITDGFFTEVDHSLRELGIGDMGVPKRMKKLARMFYGRAAAYGDALEREDRAALAAALTRNIQPEAQDWPQAGQLADYVTEAWRSLRDQEDEALAAGEIAFPSAEGEAA